MMGDRIKQMREEHNMTQKQLAEKLGLQDSAIAKYEKGRVLNMKRDTIAKMAEIFGCSPTWLMGLDDNASEEQQEIMLKSLEDLTHFRRYRALSSQQRKAVDQLIDSFLYPQDSQ